uniref:NADH-ubiquinone oxidoreductase chain 5 n=1 Tax=Iolania perkinsi TaxID=2831208 RepID=A0A8K1HZ92_9HEMI|nr:NADH dehydrogenase subunit 5 [Iolania perkinsi]
MLFCLNFFFFFFFFFLLFFFFSIYMYMFDLTYFFEWLFYMNNSCCFTCLFMFDWISLIFMSFVFLISGCVLLYSLEYMSGDLNIIRFFFLVFFFILSMVFLILMPDLICLLLGWDGLGLVSYALVIYYQNSISLSSGLLTLITNRFGDVALIFSIGWCFNFGCFHYFYLMFVDLNFYSLMVFIFIIFACLTSSAQIPFSAWLPAAMAAPTPVSSLVHSSTLVTAGVYLMIRFNFFLVNYFSFFIMFISLCTIFMSGLSAFFENDLKKIIAFSTLNQLGFMFFCLSIGSLYLSFVHLLIHAVFKSLLFLCCGFYIHSFNGVQDIRFMGNLSIQSPFVSSCFIVSLLSLCGFPFLSGFYSSDFILEMVILMEVNFFFFFFFFFSLGFTFIYTFRLLYNLFFGSCFFLGYLSLKEMNLMSFSLFILFFFSIISGSLIFWFFNSFFFYIFDYYYKFITFLLFFFFFFLFFNFLSGYFFFNYGFFSMFFSLMWFIPFFSSSFFLFNFFNFSGYLFMLVDLGWTEYLSSSLIINSLGFFSSFLSRVYMNSFSLYYFFFFFFFFFMMIF